MVGMAGTAGRRTLQELVAAQLQHLQVGGEVGGQREGSADARAGEGQHAQREEPLQRQGDRPVYPAVAPVGIESNAPAERRHTLLAA